MKILFTVNTYEPNRDGVQFVTKYLAEGLVTKGYSVDLITSYFPERTKIREENIHGVHVIRWDSYTHHTIHYGDKKGYLNKVLSSANTYDCIINVSTQTALTDWIMPVIDKVNTAKILYIHSIWTFKYCKEDFKSIKLLGKKIWANIKWRMYYKRWGKSFKKYENVVQLHKKDYSYKFFKERYGIDSIIIENAAENQFFDFEIDENIKLPKRYFINVSNYMDGKNQMKILQDFLEADIELDVELILIGSVKNQYYDKLIDYYETYCNNRSVRKRVQLLFNIPRNSIYTYVKCASAYIMASKREAFPISIIESMASGVPWISSDVGIIRYLPGGKIYDSKHTLKFWMSRFISDPELANSLGMEGREYANKNFRTEKKVEQLEACIIDSINRYKEKGRL